GDNCEDVRGSFGRSQVGEHGPRLATQRLNCDAAPLRVSYRQRLPAAARGCGRPNRGGGRCRGAGRGYTRVPVPHTDCNDNDDYETAEAAEKTFHLSGA